MTQFSSADPATITDMFELLYGCGPTAAETATMGRFKVDRSTSWRQLARRIIACLDRQLLATSFSIRFIEADLRSAQSDGFSQTYDESDVAIGQTIGAGHQNEPHIFHFFKQHLQPGMIVVDAGANIGSLTMSAASLVRQAGHVYACEPNSEDCRLILLNLQRNGIGNVTLLPFALGEMPGYSFFTPAMGSNGTLLPDTALMDPNCIVVPVMPLDALISRKVDLIKMDTEGAEGIVSRGALNIISKWRPTIVSEFQQVMLGKVSHMTPEEYLAIFVGLDYKVHVLSRQDPTAAPVAVHDIAEFMASYGNPRQILDLAIIPRERL